MIQTVTPGLKRMALALTVAISAGVLAITPAAAQNQQMEQKLMAIKQAQDTNKQKLAQYTWQETETISIKGNVKDTKVYQIQMVNGQQQKTLLNDQKAGSSGGREGRVKEHAIEKKTEEYQEYGQSDRRAGQAVHHAQSRSPDAGETGGQHLDTTWRGRGELGHQELLQAGRLDDHDHQ